MNNKVIKNLGINTYYFDIEGDTFVPKMAMSVLEPHVITELLTILDYLKDNEISYILDEDMSIVLLW